MSVSNGVISAPISIDDVASALGHNSYDLGTLCMSGNVNKWSFRKPIIHSSNGELSEQDYYNQNDGFTIVESTDPASVGLAMLNKTAWVYNRQAETDWHRLTDFLQYKSGEGEWFNFTLGSSSINSSISDGITAKITETTSYGSELGTSWLKHICTNFAQLKANTPDLGILMISKSNISNSESYYYQKIISVSNIILVSGNINFSITGLYQKFDTDYYYVIPVLAVKTGTTGFIKCGESGFPYDFCSLPINVASLLITQDEGEGIGAEFVYTRSSKSTPNYYHNIQIYVGDFKCTFYNYSPGGTYVDYHIYSYDGEYNKVYWHTESSVFVPAASSGVPGEASVSNNISGSISCYSDGYYDTSQLMIYIEYSFSNGGTTVQQTADIYYSDWVEGID